MSGFDYGKYFGAITPLADALRESPTRFWEPTREELAKPHDYVLYLGCNVLRTVHLAEAIVGVLRAMGVSFVPMGGPAHCCGIVHHRNGDERQSARLTQHSLDGFTRAAPKAVLTYCPSCHEHMDNRLPTGNFRFDLPYFHVTEFIAGRLESLPFERRVQRRVGLHAHQGGEQSCTDARHTAAILRAIPGLELVELTAPADWGRHCAPHQAADMGVERFQACVAAMFQEAQAQGCDAVATVYHSCYRELLPNETRYGLEFLNYVELLAEALGLGPFPARYKALKLAGDPEAAYAQLAPRAAANGGNVPRLRQSVEQHFAPAVPTPPREGGVS